MKISKSKQELARIISENGGRIDTAGFAAQDQNAVVTFFVDKPWRCDAVWECENFEAVGGFGVTEEALKNWHQTIVSRDEYFHLYPAPNNSKIWEHVLATPHHGYKTSDNGAIEDDDGWDNLGSSVVRDLKFSDGRINTGDFGSRQAPTIEQLAADYRNAKDYADRKQGEADAAKADADAKLAELVAAGKAHGLVLSVAEQELELEPELVITDWRDLRVGDIVWWSGDSRFSSGEYQVYDLEEYEHNGSCAILLDVGGCKQWIDHEDEEWRFIRRP